MVPKDYTVLEKQSKAQTCQEISNTHSIQYHKQHTVNKDKDKIFKKWWLMIKDWSTMDWIQLTIQRIKQARVTNTTSWLIMLKINFQHFKLLIISYQLRDARLIHIDKMRHITTKTQWIRCKETQILYILIRT